jgi:hypothetical protein
MRALLLFVFALTLPLLLLACGDADSDGDGWRDDADCVDDDATIHPEAEELCNGVDDDCDREIDEGHPEVPWYGDQDGDSYGGGFSLLLQCMQPDGYVSNQDDCDDTDPEINPEAIEVECDGADNDCDDATEEAPDADADGFDVCEDCEDDNADVNPDAIEIQCNGLDDDCWWQTEDEPDEDEDGASVCTDCDDVDEDVSPLLPETTCNALDDDCDPTTLDQPDADADGFTVCEECDDSLPGVNPDAEEVFCNDLDDDCDVATTDTPDGDGDGFTLCDDCDDVDPAVNPDGIEVTCDGADNDCDPTTQDEPDGDGDGVVLCLDCDDTVATTYPGAPETICNDVDDDCDPATTDQPDDDGDGYPVCTDCDDDDQFINPGVAEATCDTIDNDCDPTTLDEPDDDADTYVVCDDCDDSDPAVNPGVFETLCNAIDDDCEPTTLDDDAFEDNDDSAAAVALGESSNTGLIACPGDSDFFALDLLEGQLLATDAMFDAVEGDVDVYLLDPSGALLLSSVSASSDEWIDYVVPADGIHLLEIVLAADAGVVPGNSYDLELAIGDADVCPDDAFETNDDLVAAGMAGDGTFTGLTVCAGRDDFYEAQISMGSWLWLDAYFTHTDGDVDMYVRDQTGAVVASSVTATDHEEINYMPPTADPVYIQVQLASDSGDPGNEYELQVFGSTTGCVADSLEPNNTLASATPVGVAGSWPDLHVCPSSDLDWFEFTLGAGATLDIEVLFAHAEGDIGITLYDSGGNTAASSNTASDDEGFSYTSTAGGTYQMAVVLGTDQGLAPGNSYTLIVGM